MVYAIFGMPLFLMWASQMGTLLAQSFQFFYSNICCVVCRRGKRKRAAAKAAKRQNELLALEKQQQQELAEQQQQFKMPLVLESENEKTKGGGKGYLLYFRLFQRSVCRVLVQQEDPTTRQQGKSQQHFGLQECCPSG